MGWFVMGLFIGTVLGVIIMSLCVTLKDNDRGSDD